MERTPENIAWCAGLYEGEGTVIYGASHKGPLRIKISSTDLDVLELMRDRSGIGSISGPYGPKGFGKKPFHVWIANGFEAVSLLHDMAPLLGVRRAARAAEKIALWEQRPVRVVKATPEVRANMRALRAEGWSYPDIARRFEVSMPYAYQICYDGKRARRRWAVAPTE